MLTSESEAAFASAPLPEPEQSPVRYVREGLFAGLAGLLATIPVLQYWRQSFGIPTMYEGDATFYLMVLRGMREDGGYLRNSSLGWPYGQELHDLPQGADNAHLLVMQVLSWLFEPATALNLFFVLSFVTVTGVAHVALRRLGARRAPSLVGALLYAFLPYHFLRGTSHLLLSSYAMVPVIVLLVIAVIGDEPPLVASHQGRRPKWRGGRETLWVLAACVGLGSTGSYYGVFAAWLIGVCCILAAVSRRSIVTLWSGLSCCTAIAVAALLNLAPTIWYWATKGANPAVAARLAQETEQLGLRIQQFFMPRIDHRVPKFGRLGYRSFAGPIYSEQGQTLGVILAVSLVITIGALFVGILRRDQPESRRWEIVRHAGLIALICCLTATISGISFLLSLAGLKDIRSWNRMVVVIAFCAVVGFVSTAESAFEWATRRWDERRARNLGAVGLVAVLLVGWFDQTSPRDSVSGNPLAKAYWQSDEEFFGGLADTLPAESAVFTLPMTTFPEGGSVVSVGLYDHARGYIHAPTLNWSFGAMRGRSPAWPQEWLDLSGVDIRQEIRAAGFRAVIVDRFGFVDSGVEMIDRLGSVTPPAGQSPDGRYVWFDLVDE